MLAYSVQNILWFLVNSRLTTFAACIRLNHTVDYPTSHTASHLAGERIAFNFTDATTVMLDNQHKWWIPQETEWIYVLFNLRRTMHKIVVPELVVVILDQLDESDEKAPWVWSVHNQSFKQHPDSKTDTQFINKLIINKNCAKKPIIINCSRTNKPLVAL